MNKVNFCFNRFTVTKLIGLFLICLAVLLGQGFYVNRILSQEVEQTAKDTQKQMEKEEKLSVEVLRNDQAQITNPAKVLEAIDDLGKVARLRGVSSTDTMNALAEYLDVHKDSFSRSKNEATELPEFTLPRRQMIPEECYPAVLTFAHIGKPAIPILVRVIEESESGSVKSNNAIFLIKHNFREDWNKAADYLRESAELAKTEEGRQRLLDAAVEVLRTVR